jgi:prevent-host-death family protein
MPEVTATSAKRQFGTLLAVVADGERITITRYGRPVAMIVRVAAVESEAQPAEAWEQVFRGIQTFEL